ncbi:MAG: amidohydrolase family protein [Acidobacteria bacterium]|nr:amidohydrolase family protein [Acidobacteriota bacterium]
MNHTSLPLGMAVGLSALLAASPFAWPTRAPAPQADATRAFVGATLFDGAAATPLPDAVLIVRSGRVVSAGPAATTTIPAGAERVDVSGRFIMPGLINAHGHVGSAAGLESGAAVNTEANVRRQLALNARYGITTVVSLGDDREPGFAMRRANEAPDLDRARVFVAGPVVTAKSPDEARRAVREVAALKPDWIKIRVDDNLGATTKMAPEVYRAVIEEAHGHKLRVAAHMFYLADAMELLRAGADLLAHSVRDRPVDQELIDLMKARDVCLSPTLMREVSTFVYESRPSFFDDPFFTREVDPQVIAALEDPTRQASTAKSRAAQAYKKGLEVARRNVKALHDAGVRIASGTDSGPPARFQGYFEHLELEELMRAGLTPAQALLAGTGTAAACMGLADRLGTLEAGRAADFVVLSRNPLEDIRHTRTIESVWIAGNRVPMDR